MEGCQAPAKEGQAGSQSVGLRLLHLIVKVTVLTIACIAAIAKEHVLYHRCCSNPFHPPTALCRAWRRSFRNRSPGKLGCLSKKQLKTMATQHQPFESPEIRGKERWVLPPVIDPPRISCIARGEALTCYRGSRRRASRKISLYLV